MSRWITVNKVPFDYVVPDMSSIIAFTEKGEHRVTDAVADFAVEKGYATEGKAEGSTARSVKGKGGRPKKAVADAAIEEANTEAAIVVEDDGA